MRLAPFAAERSTPLPGEDPSALPALWGSPPDSGAAVGSAVALAAGGVAYYYSGDTTRVPPEGSLGLFDLR